MCEECGGGHQTSKCTKVPTEEVNYMGGQQWPYNNFQQKGFQNIHGNYNQEGDNKPQQRPNLWDHTAKLEEALTKLIEVVITNYKNTEVAIKSMETQIGPLAKQLQNSSIGFSVAIKENPKVKKKKMR